VSSKPGAGHTTKEHSYLLSPCFSSLISDLNSRQFKTISTIWEKVSSHISDPVENPAPKSSVSNFSNRACTPTGVWYEAKYSANFAA
jgi:hypothetical protein